MKSRFLLFTLLITSSSFAGERWSSPDKAYSITPPAEWQRSAHSPSYAFTSPDQKAEIRITAAYRISLPSTMPDEVLEMAFPTERGITPTKRVRGIAWDGLRREYTDESGSARWLGFAARHGSTVVLLTMKAPAKEIDRFRPIFDSVTQSLRFAP